MKPDSLRALLKEQLIPAFDAELRGLHAIDKYMRNQQDTARLPRRVGAEHRNLAKISKSPWLRLVVNSTVQMLDAEGVFSSEGDLKEMWKPWERNRFQSRQIALYRDAISFGTGYVTGLPGELGSEHVAALRPYSPLEMFAVYADPSEDEWPMYGLRAIPQPNDTTHYRILDEKYVHFLSKDKKSVEFIESREHNIGFCPIVRYSPRLDLMGRADGDVEPHMTIADRLDKTEYDRLLAQHYNSWKVKTATNLDDDVSDEAEEKIRMKLSHEDILIGTGETQFGTLPETPLGDLNEAKESHVETLAAISQTPTTALSGKMVNVSADGLAESKASAYAKRNEFQTTLGGSHLQMLRLAAHIENRPSDAIDYTAKISWADTETRTLNQAIDGLGKAATMLGVPPELLWSFIPGVSQPQADAWKRYAQENPSLLSQRDVDAFMRHDEPTYPEVQGGENS